MKAKLTWASAAALLLLSLVLWMPEGLAQQSRPRPSRRVTNPVRRSSSVLPAPTPDASPDTSEPRLISTAEDAQGDATSRTPTRTRRNASQTQPPQQNEAEQLRRTVDGLSTQVNRLSDDLNQMKTDQRAMFDLERLTRAEQRAEGLRSQLRDVTDKEFQLQERAAQLEDEMEPGAIERRAATMGTLNASQLRDQIRRGLEREKERVQRQLEMLGNSRARLEQAVASADLEVERLRQRIEASEAQQNSATGGTGNTTAPAGTTPNGITPAGATNAPATQTPAPTATPTEPPE